MMTTTTDPAQEDEDAAQAAEAAAADAVNRMNQVKAIGSDMWTDLSQRKILRSAQEIEWVNAEYAYEGVYTPDQAADIVGTDVFVNLTRPKTNAFAAHLSDMLMPGGDDRCFDVQPSPKPILAQTSGDQAVVSKTPEGADVTLGDVSDGIIAEAKKRAKGMMLLCDDQLAQTGYNTQFRKAIFHGAKLGTIIMRGPTKSAKIKKMWKQVKGATYEQVENDDAKNCPSYEAVNPFHFYPEPFARRIEHSDKNFETFFLTGKALRRMARTGFDGAAIKEVLEAEKKMGNPPEWYTKLAAIATADNAGGAPREGAQTVKGLFEVWLCTTELYGDELLSLFPDADPQLDSVPVSIWGVGEIIIKAEITPLDEGEIYSVAQFVENENSLFGHGVPWAGANAQQSLNSAWRMVIDNGAASAVPAVAIWKSRIQPADNNWAYRPAKTWYIKGNGDEGDEASLDVRRIIQYIDHPVKLDQLLAIYKTAKEMFDEEVAFSLVMQGETGPYTPDTAGGTNTHYNAGRIVLRRVVSNIDDNITVPNIQRLINWNMAFSDDETVKGDLSPIAKGASVLMARMEQLQAMNAGMPVLLNPAYRHKIDQDKVIEAYVTNLRLSDVLRSEADSKKIAKEMQEQAQQQGQNADPYKMAMAEIAKGRLQLDAQRHADEFGLEQNYMEHAFQQLGLNKEDLIVRAGLDRMKVDAAAKRFNAEMTAKMRTGRGI